MNKKPKLILKTNISFSIVILIVNIFIFYTLYSNKNLFLFGLIFINFLLYFLYRYGINSLINKYWIDIKKEIFNINYPLNISLILGSLIIILLFDILNISMINKEALNPTFIFSFFIKTLTNCLPALLLYTYMFLICPAFSVPKYDKKYKSKSDLIMFILFLIFIIYSIFQLIISGINNGYDKKSKFRAIKMPVTYTEKFIKYSGLTRERIHVLEKTKAEAPFYYTSEGFNFDKYEDAEEFCKSLNAKVANHKEIYNIIFNKFDTFGNQYYWTSEKAGVNNLLLRFKNMTYEIVINPGNTKPAVYCTIPASEDFVLQNNRFFTRILPETTKNKMNKINIKELLAKSQEEKDKLIQQQNLEDKQSVEDEQFVEDKQSVKNEQSLNNENSLRTTEEAVYINFSIKHVTKEVFDALLSKGYLYNPEHKANSYYEINNSNLNSLKGLYLNNSDNNVRYCYYPFAEYQNLNLNNEKEIWKQNFCIPSFTLIQRQPVLKNRYEKDVYCYANGGRVPNIAELAAVIKVLNINPTGQSFWTNIKITDISSMEQLPVSIYYTKDGFITVQAEASNQEINTFCITQSEEHSNIIANYASKFWNEDGKNYAQMKCPSCRYYEMPDTVLLQ